MSLLYVVIFITTLNIGSGLSNFCNVCHITEKCKLLIIILKEERRVYKLAILLYLFVQRKLMFISKNNKSKTIIKHFSKWAQMETITSAI